MMDTLSVVSQLRDLASEPQNRQAIVQDQGCLPGLVLFLDHKDPKVLFATLQVHSGFYNYHFSGHGLNHWSLTDYFNAPFMRQACQNPEQQRRMNKPQFFINRTNKKAKSVTLHIQGSDGADQRCVCEEALLKVKGVISFTFQMAMKRYTVRIRADLPTSLATAIAATKVLSVQQVVKNDSGEEVGLAVALGLKFYLYYGSSFHPTLHLWRNDRRDYLPEDESPEKELDRAVSRTGAKPDTNGIWLNTASSFLTKTFYW
ncbi:armadillo repeat containing 1, like [Xyrauchen texanus]|uniref:armadillo repeat containing 1, like n=1 Tax=Xyrauchen texanus TaxID=154827 RepID=UPI002241CDB3|nr:armadillo repeat containing 1, like [Xyrauchen texanus]